MICNLCRVKSVTNLVSIYEKIDDWSAAEIAHEQLLMSLKEKGADYQKLVQEAENLGSMYLRFRKMVEGGDSSLYALGKLSIIRRAAFLDGLLFSTLLIEIASRSRNDHIQAGLITAAKRDALNMARVLLAPGANDNARNCTGQTPLLTAVQYGSTAMVKLLPEKNADIEAKSTDSMAVLDATMHRNPELVESMLSLVIEAGVDLKERNKHGMTPLAVAMGFNFLTAARLLFKAGADIDARDWTGSTALHESVVSTNIQRGPSRKLKRATFRGESTSKTEVNVIIIVYCARRRSFTRRSTSSYRKRGKRSYRGYGGRAKRSASTRATEMQRMLVARAQRLYMPRTPIYYSIDRL